MDEARFGDLRRLADWLRARSSSSSVLPTALVLRLGRTAVPLLGRALRCAEPGRREAARNALATLAGQRADARPRVVGELHAIADDRATPDDTKVCAVGLLAELGERGEARFADGLATRRRAALALAAQLDTAAEVASAVDLMLQRLADADIADMVDAMAEAAPNAAARLAGELACRLDASAELVARIATGATSPPALARGERRPARTTVLVDAAARLVVVASRKLPNARRWRRWAVLIGTTGRIDDCLHVDGDAPAVAGDLGDAATLIDTLVAQGYRVATTAPDHARAIVAAAARLTASERGAALGSAYYLGRDLLDLGDAHLDGRPRVAVVASTLGRAVDLIAGGEPDRALALLARCDVREPEVAAAIAACLTAQGRHVDAIEHLHAACAGDREWPLHHWNLAAALHATGDAGGCCAALRGFLATSETAIALELDGEQPSRVALARRLVSERERTARLDRVSAARDKPRRRRARPRGAKSR